MQLFTPFSIKNLTLKNRVVMAPMATRMADERGYPTPALIEHYAARARGGTGMVIVEAALVSEYPSVSEGRLGLWRDDQTGPLGELAAAISAGGAVPAIQICDLNLRATGRKPAAMSNEEIEAMISAFVRAAERAAKAGFAAVDIHAAHSTTLADFLSRRANDRKDAYGGGEAGRARVVTQVVAATRAALGPKYPLLCRFNGDEFILDGNTLLHTIPIARLLVEAGVDVLDVSAGCRPEDGEPAAYRASYSNRRGRPAPWLPDGPNLHIAAAFKRALNVPVIAVGKLGNPAVAEQALVDGACDLIALGRPLLAEPDWARKVAAGRPLAIKTCRCCDLCMELFNEKKAVHCVKFGNA